MNDTNFPWLILVPRQAGLRDFHDVAPEDETDFLGEINQAARRLKEMTGADKMNVAALGNMVPQLHVHIIARFESDAAWPGPVWGANPPVAYETQASTGFVEAYNRFDN